MKTRRVEAALGDIDLVMALVRRQLNQRLAEKGWGCWVSPHEILGAVTEEYHELIEAVHTARNNQVDLLRWELVDLAVGAIFGVVSIEKVGPCQANREGFCAWDACPQRRRQQGEEQRSCPLLDEEEDGGED